MHYHLIGICGTAMASLAGMLQQRGFRVTGSDAAAYPPMSDFLASLNIPLSQPFAAANLDPKPDLVVVGNAISRGNAELERMLDERIPFSSLPQILHALSTRPAEILGLPAGRLERGAPADLIVFDPDAPYVLDKRLLRSLSKNTPFDEARLEVQVTLTLVAGRIVFDRRSI